ncbi:MAG TPA: YCF48-related protein [Ignavibacteria bacterium]|nr:YCF48-related protein [Ignavibacteria bacterium]
MKKIILILFLYTLTFSISEAQWILQNSFTNNNLYDVEFYNRNTGWAVGDGGTILKTTNGGTNWNHVPNPAVGKPLSSIHIVDSNVCYVVGWFETIIKTTDGGISWIVIRNNGWGFGSSYNAVFFIDENTGWIAGTGQKVLRTTNGGDSITTDYLFAGNLYDMYFKDALTGIVTGSGTDMFKTTNGGLSWNNIVMPIGFRIPDFYKLTFVYDLTGWVAGSDRRIFKTTDFGDTWFYFDSMAVSPQMRCIEFIDENTGYVGGEQGYLFKSTNGGENWVRENTSSFPPNEIISMFLYDNMVGWIVGGEAKIYGTTTGGQTLVNIISSSNIESTGYSISQNFPNPFNSKTKIYYKIGKEAFIRINIIDLSGKEIKTLINKKQNTGNYGIDFDASDLSSGIYFYSLYINNKIMDNKKFVLLK